MVFEARALHYVFRIANRKESYDFYTKVLGMKVLRHEEFDEPCKAACNGPFDGVWSKTMIGYGNEDEHFVIELTYNYGVHSYELGNDFHGIHIESDDVFKRVEKVGQKLDGGSVIVVKDPDGHVYFVQSGSTKYPVTKVSVNVTDLSESREFWSTLLGMKVESATEDKCLLSYGQNQCKLELIALGGVPLERKTAFGRIAFATPEENLKPLEARMKVINEHYIQFPLVSLDTPGKARARVVILRDPNEHEICFVGDERFRELSKIDPKGDELMLEAMKKDQS